MPARKVCSQPGCPELTSGGRCVAHTREADKARGTRQQRGYDRNHDQLRAHLAPHVAAGQAHCWRCHKPITPDEPWHLGHDDHDRRQHRGPEHVQCNLSAAGKAAHRGGG